MTASTDYDSSADTLKHIEQVKQFASEIAQMLIERVQEHDKSKLEDPEKAAFDIATPRLSALTYGSDKYKATLAEMRPAIEHHHQANRHHPEYFSGGLCGMDLLDLLEMYCDWCAATLRHEDGHIGRSIHLNRQRFGYGHILAHIMVNTSRRYRFGKGCGSAYAEGPIDERQECKA